MTRTTQKEIFQFFNYLHNTCTWTTVLEWAGLCQFVSYCNVCAWLCKRYYNDFKSTSWNWNICYVLMKWTSCIVLDNKYLYIVFMISNLYGRITRINSNDYKNFHLIIYVFTQVVPLPTTNFLPRQRQEFLQLTLWKRTKSVGSYVRARPTVKAMATTV